MAAQLPPIKVYASRDFRKYRLVQSPVADIAHRFYTFITSDSPEASHARFAYATAYSGSEPSMSTAGGPFVGSELDLAVQDMLSAPPCIVLAQGPMHPWGLFAPEMESERQSLRSVSTVSSTASGVVIEPVSAIFLPWQVHQALKDAMDADERDEAATAAYFLFAGIVHETAHWIAANRHGYKHDPTRDAHLTSMQARLDFEKAKIVQHSRRDWGTHAKELLLGFAFTFVSYADGTHEVVSQRIQPVIPKLKPAIAPDVQSRIIGFPSMPRIIDISKYGAPNVRAAPSWRKSDFLIVSSISPDNACHHGACRIRPGM
ncbi:hypothetical protein EXIGLDRAFT_763387 [Exidia glandulosa HHB12029]|uniref:Uncharacterized protein n=1 Tax=Exidia glandulosa HHB12029 TaxID=1314781 RepID=A0A165LZ53_EXIGL|nr:hypothetical protein EXIGLDRAFT_763387 [Exidia glandulosa HHB12029]